MDVEEDKYFMNCALREAQKAYDQGEVPIGCVIVHEGKIIAKSHNSVEQLKDPTAHAEILAIGIAAAHLNNWRLLNTTMYCTLEPCLMCAGAIQLARISKLIWGAKDLRLGANGSWLNVFQENHPFHQVSCCSGVYAEQSEHLMKQFFIEQRAKNEK